MAQIEFYTTQPGSKNYDVKKHIWNIDNQLDIDSLLLLPEFSKFEICARIKKSNNSAGYEISVEDKFRDQNFVIYVITILGKVLKGGKSKNKLDKRSYSAGTEESWTDRGTPSVTNYVWSQIFRSCIEKEDEVIFYGMIAPSYEMTYESFDGQIMSKYISPYEEEEKKLNHLLKKLNKKNLIGEGKLLDVYKK